MSELYRELIIDHYKHPRNMGTLVDYDFFGSDDNVVCGDRISWQIACNAGKVAAAKWNGEGCALSQAAASLLSEKLIGKTPDELRQISDSDVLSIIGEQMNPSRRKCATLCIIALQKALTTGR